MVGFPEEREPPLWRNVVLLGGFLLVVVASIFTVLVPELKDEQKGEESQRTGEARQSDGGVSGGAPPSPTPGRAAKPKGPTAPVGGPSSKGTTP